jgi:hypothetical protein
MRSDLQKTIDDVNDDLLASVEDRKRKRMK